MAIKKIDLSGPIKRWKEARKGKEVRAANVEAFEQIQTVVNVSIDGVNKAAEDVQENTQTANAAVAAANSALTNANSALKNAADTRQDVLDRLAAGEFKGERGEKGNTGAQGESGVMVPSSGMFSLFLDSATGDLYADYPDGEAPPAFEYEADTGDLYYVTG